MRDSPVQLSVVMFKCVVTILYNRLLTSPKQS